MWSFVQATVDDGVVEGSTGPDLVVDALWAMTNPGLFRLFISHRSWTTSQYGVWFERHAIVEMESLGAAAETTDGPQPAG